MSKHEKAMGMEEGGESKGPGEGDERMVKPGEGGTRCG